MSRRLDDIAPSFRAAKDRWPDAPLMQAQYVDLAKTFEENGSSLLELCKSFLEMVCITVVKELGSPLPATSTPRTSDLLACALNAVGLRNEQGEPSRGTSALCKVIAGYKKLAKGLDDARRNEGTVAHGKDGFIDVISDRCSRVYLLSADAIIALILDAYEGLEPNILHTRENHARFKRHNAKIDTNIAIDSEVEDDSLVLTFRAGIQREEIQIRTTPSQLLYYLDRQAYVSILNDIRGLEQPKVEEEPPVKMPTLPHTEAMQLHHLKALKKYSGRYIEKVSPLYDHIIHSLLGGKNTQAAQVQNLTYTLLNGMEDLAVVDWSTRESTRSAVRVFVKKLFSLFAIDGLGPEATEEIVNWLAGQIVGGES